MPSRNRLKIYLADSFYHLYNRGINKRVIFKDRDDYTVFLNLLKRYLHPDPIFDLKGREYERLHDRIELLAFCLMPNHFHLLAYPHDEHAMTRLLQGISGAYTRYFNTKYKRRGTLFEDRYKASNISSDSYLIHISRYIHLNPTEWRIWEFSSLPYYLQKKNAPWVKSQRILDLHEGKDYLAFLEDYEDHKKMLDTIKYELANY